MLQPGERRFPLEYQCAMVNKRKLKEILARQGASPRRSRQCQLREVYQCRRCRTLLATEAVQEAHPYWRARGSCSTCEGCIYHDDCLEVAVTSSNSSRLQGRISVLGRENTAIVEPNPPVDLACHDAAMSVPAG